MRRMERGERGNRGRMGRKNTSWRGRGRSGMWWSRGVGVVNGVIAER